MRLTVKRAAKFLNTNENHVKLLASEGKMSKVVDGKIEFQSVVDYQWTRILGQFDRLIMHEAVRDNHGF